VDSFIGTKEFLTNLFDQIYNLMFVKDFKIVILLENGHQHDAEEEEKIKFKDFQKFPALWIRSSEPGQLDHIYKR
jgi:hypothetical protein